MSDVQSLRRAMEQAETEFKCARDAYHEAVRAAHPIKVGMVIRNTEGVLAKVIRIGVIERFSSASVDVIAVLQKQSGEWGTRRASTWRPQWKDPTIVEPQP